MLNAASSESQKGLLGENRRGVGPAIEKPVQPVDKGLFAVVPNFVPRTEPVGVGWASAGAAAARVISVSVLLGAFAA